MADRDAPDFESMRHHDFCDVVLYVSPGDPSSERAKSVVTSTSVHIQNVAELPRPLPAWLVGVPTCVVKSEKRAYRGTACIDKLREQARGAWTGASAGASYIGGFNDGASIACTGMASIASLDAEDPPPHEVPREAPRPEAAAPGGRHIDQSDVDAYMRARGSSEPATHQPVFA